MAVERDPQLPRVRNPKTEAQTQHETLWQVTVPLGVTLMVVVGLVIFLGLSAAGVAAPAPIRSLADVSLMFLITLAASGSLVVLLVLAGLCAAAWYGLRELPYLFKRVQDFAWLVEMNAKTATRQVDNRVVEVHLSMAAVRSLAASLQELFGLGKGRAR